MNNNDILLQKLLLSSSSIANFPQLAIETALSPDKQPRVLQIERRENVTIYTTLYPSAGLLLDVKVTEDTPSITQDKITAAGGMLPVDFANFRARTWRTDRGEIRMSVKADKVIPTTSVPTKP